MDINISTDSLILEGNIEIPKESRGVVMFAHGSGSGRRSPRNNFVAQVLQQSNLGTLLFDLLSEEEDEIFENRFNIDLLTQRLLSVTRWLEKKKKGNIGYFGASTGAAAALRAAAQLGPKIRAVVSRGGRPDLAMEELSKVKSPTLLIVGGDDEGVIELNQKAYEKLNCTKELKIIPGASHLFEEPGTLEEVARLAALWFKKYL